MDWLNTALGTIGSVVSGGLTGLLGIGVQRYFDMKNKQLDLQIMDKKHAHELAMKKADAEIVAQEWAARTQIAMDENRSQVEVADSQAFAASFNEPVRFSDGIKPNSAQAWLLVILDFIRGIVRPGLTMYLCALTTAVYFKASALVDPALDGVQYFKIVSEVVDTILYLFVTCSCWWFGVRNRGKNAKA